MESGVAEKAVTVGKATTFKARVWVAPLAWAVAVRV